MHIKQILPTAAFLFAFALNSNCAISQVPVQPASETTAVQDALTTFLRAFDNLDWPAFRACFASDVTMFHPAAPNVKRVDTPEEFEKAWLGVFARIKKTSGRNSPPYMNLQPKDLKIQLLSQQIALVTFHLLEGHTVSRRTILLRKSDDGWKIVHIHASNIALPDSPNVQSSTKP
jgi:ketosteroid isomerase-like protein